LGAHLAKNVPSAQKGKKPIHLLRQRGKGRKENMLLRRNDAVKIHRMAILTGKKKRGRRGKKKEGRDGFLSKREGRGKKKCRRSAIDENRERGARIHSCDTRKRGGSSTGGGGKKILEKNKHDGGKSRPVAYTLRKRGKATYPFRRKGRKGKKGGTGSRSFSQTSASEEQFRPNPWSHQRRGREKKKKTNYSKREKGRKHPSKPRWPGSYTEHACK